MDTKSILGNLFGDASDRRARRALELCHKLLSERGEASGAALAREALAACQELDETSRAQFFDALAHQFSPAQDEAVAAADAYRREPTPAHLAMLQEVVEPPRQELLRRLNAAPGGTAAVVEMRKALLRGLARHPGWRVVDRDMLHLLRSWFNRGFLRLERIDWRTSALVLEKLIAYEAVHAIQGWNDLRRRLQADRRCFAFFHPSLPDEPLIFIEVALTRELAAEVGPLIALDAPVEPPLEAKCAMFYSITNCQEGLRGISFGNFLIKQVAEDLQNEFPHLRTFATLSPIPGFRAWLESVRERIGRAPRGAAALEQLGRIDAPGWQHAPEQKDLRELLMHLGAYYLVRAKQGDGPLDPVARFHLGNGAALERINWLGDTSEHGLSISAGLMVNYIYRLKDVERNHERFVKEHVVVASHDIERLARSCLLAEEDAHMEKR